MSVKVASLYAEIGANVDGFMRGTGQVKSQLKSLTPRIEGAAGSVTGFVTANAGLISVLAAVGTATNKLIKDYAAYAESVALVSRTSGTTAEEASRLIIEGNERGEGEEVKEKIKWGSEILYKTEFIEELD